MLKRIIYNNLPPRSYFINLLEVFAGFVCLIILCFVIHEKGIDKTTLKKSLGNTKNILQNLEYPFILILGIITLLKYLKSIIKLVTDSHTNQKCTDINDYNNTYDWINSILYVLILSPILPAYGLSYFNFIVFAFIVLGLINALIFRKKINFLN